MKVFYMYLIIFMYIFIDLPNHALFSTLSIVTAVMVLSFPIPKAMTSNFYKIMLNSLEMIYWSNKNSQIRIKMVIWKCILELMDYKIKMMMMNYHKEDCLWILSIIASMRRIWSLIKIRWMRKSIKEVKLRE
jgi:hypothetical protein